MRDSSYNSSHQTKQIFSRGGEKKVMKKSLSFLLAIALVFGMFSAMASAATPSTPAEAGAVLKELGVLKGDDGDLLEGTVWKRQDIVVLLARLLAKEEAAAATAKSHTFKDVPKGYYDGFLSWAKAEGYVNGYSATKFGFNDELTVKDFAAVVLRALGIKNDETIAADAVKAGIFAEGTDFAAKAKRGDTFVALVAALNAEVAGTGKTLGEVLGLPGFNVALAVKGAKQTGAKKITVELSRALKADEETALKASVKNGLVPYPVTIKASEDKKSVVLEATFLPAAEYDVVINEFAAVKVTVAAEVITKIDIGAVALQNINGQDLLVKPYNQFGEVVASAYTDINVSAYTSEAVTANNLANVLRGTNNFKVDLAAYKVDGTVVVTASHSKSGVVASKTFKIVSASSATNITLGAVVPKTDETRIFTGRSGANAYTLPITLKDQYGAEFKLPASVTANVYNQIGGITFASSNTAIIDPASFNTNGDSVLKFNTGATAGVVVVTAFNSATGASASVSVNVEAPASLKSFQLNNPAAIVVDGEEVTIPYVAADTFGSPIANKDVPASAKVQVNGADTLTFTANSVPVTPKWKANGDLVLSFTGTGTKVVTALVKGIPVSTITVDVKDAAYPVSITGTKDLKTTLAVYGAQTIAGSNTDIGKLVVVDNYGRAMGSLPTGWTLAVAEDGANAALSLTGFAATAGSAAGSEKVTATLSKTGATSVSYDIAFTVVKIEDVKSVTIGAVGTVYGHASNTISGANVKHSVELSLTGKTAAGVEVAVRATDFFDLVTSSDSAILATDADPTTSLKIVGKAEGTATVTVWKNGAKLNEQTVTVAKAAPAIATVKFTASEYTFVPATPAGIVSKLEIKDQYGVAFDGADNSWITADVNGKWFSSDPSVATISNSGTIAKQKSGIVTITYVSGNGVSASITVNVD
ncbi:hypothetical protein [Cohnella sp. GCM10027633]|uniref:hypothetical protein n=1 Tax=unclassified Cohnella TaxID=2636738 RepID=UPI00363FB4CA